MRGGKWSHTEDTEYTKFLHGFACIYRYFFEPLMARIFTNAMRSGHGLTQNSRNTQNHAERDCLTQTAQTFAETCGAKFCVIQCIPCANKFPRLCVVCVIHFINQ